MREGELQRSCRPGCASPRSNGRFGARRYDSCWSPHHDRLGIPHHRLHRAVQARHDNGRPRSLQAVCSGFVMPERGRHSSRPRGQTRVVTAPKPCRASRWTTAQRIQWRRRWRGGVGRPPNPASRHPLHADARHKELLRTPTAPDRMKEPAADAQEATPCQDGGPHPDRIVEKRWKPTVCRFRHRLAGAAPGEYRILSATAKKLA